MSLNFNKTNYFLTLIMNLEYLEHHPIFSIKEVYYVGCVSVYQ